MISKNGRLMFKSNNTNVPKIMYLIDLLNTYIWYIPPISIRKIEEIGGEIFGCGFHTQSNYPIKTSKGSV